MGLPQRNWGPVKVPGLEFMASLVLWSGKEWEKGWSEEIEVRFGSLPIGPIFTELLGMNVVAGREDKPENPLLPIGLMTRPPLGDLLIP